MRVHYKMANCEKCYKFHNSVVSKECNFCRDYMFKENILCDLLQAEHQSYEVECQAFKPNLAAIDSTNQQQAVVESRNLEVKLTDHHKWLKAYAIQQWKYDDSQIFCDLNYHLCLVANNRNRSIKKLSEAIEEVSVIFTEAGEKFKGKVSLLWIGADHIHLHVNSSPDYSADEVVQIIITFLEDKIKSKFQEIFSNQEKIFQKTYFIETIG